MDPIKTQLQVLIECLKKKQHALEQIASITDNQGFVLTSGMPDDDVRAFFTQMNVEKQSFIHIVLQCDNVFENVLKVIGPALDADQANYPSEVLTLQGGIKRVMDLDVQIRVAEENNNRILTMSQQASGVKNEINEKEKPPVIDGGAYGAEKLMKEYQSNSRHYKGN